ncbi:uncharacterized protein LOC103509846 [Diaphorina citri]|uniref:Uncharacterized protein LOC103509846 n=1 Tax=Diaphorina citri TaxID=121845 RepID=A0A3Q0IYV8_DIACI|nr:uncharacterized protein LOC103509846 [Diaphorina citri]
MEEEIDLEEVQLKVLTAKKQQLFSSIQRIFDVSKNVGSESSRATFLKKVGTVEVLFKEFVTTLEKCCSLELRINPGGKKYHKLILLDVIFSPHGLFTELSLRISGRDSLEPFSIQISR